MITFRKDFLSYFQSLKTNVKEFGYYGIDDLDLFFPLHKCNSTALLCYRQQNPSIIGVKSKYNYILDVPDMKLMNVNDYDVLENIQVTDDLGTEYDFDIIRCSDRDGSCEMIKEKTMLLSTIYSYKIYFRLPNNHEEREFYVKADGYMFVENTRRQLLQNFL